MADFLSIPDVENERCELPFPAAFGVGLTVTPVEEQSCLEHRGNDLFVYLTSKLRADRAAEPDSDVSWSEGSSVRGDWMEILQRTNFAFPSTSSIGAVFLNH
jgi:hypothetical protein